MKPDRPDRPDRPSRLLTPPMSTCGVRLLRYMLEYDLTPTGVKQANQTWVRSLLVRGLAREIAGGGLTLTGLGTDVARSYGGHELIKRKVTGELSETVARLLKVSRIRQMNGRLARSAAA